MISATSKLIKGYPKSNRNRDKSKSRSRSKSPSYTHKNKFYFNQKSLFLTYPHTEKGIAISRSDLGNYLRDAFKCKIVVVCQEKHADGNPHLHCWLEWDEQFFTSNPRLFDFRGHHPHFGRMKDNKKNTRQNVLNYMIKEDTNLFAIGIDINQWKYCSQNKNKYICEDLISGNASLPDIVDKNPSVLMNYNRLKVNLEAYKLDKSQNTSIFKTNNNLWICSPPGTGKTYYATHLYPSFFLKPQNKWWDGYRGEPVVILDDFDDAKMSHYIKIWSDNYNSIGEIKNGTVTLKFNTFIITSNYMPINYWPNDLELRMAIYRRFNFISVGGTFPNFYKIPMPNPSETDYY